jgi:hypothetical protein
MYSESCCRVHSLGCVDKEEYLVCWTTGSDRSTCYPCPVQLSGQSGTIRVEYPENRTISFSMEPCEDIGEILSVEQGEYGVVHGNPNQ